MTNLFKALALLALLSVTRAFAGGECLEVTTPSTTVKGGTYKCIVVGDAGAGSILDGVTVQDSPYNGIAIYADRVTLRDAKIFRSSGQGILIGCSEWQPDGTCPHVPSKVTIQGGRIERGAYNGIKIDICNDCVISKVLVRYNHNSGIHINDAHHWELSDSEVSYNGTADYLAHGCYCNGVSGKILRNRFHHNTGYGIHAWPEPQGTRDDPFVIQQNKVYRNGTGIVIGAAGTHVRFWLNEEWSNEP